MAKILALGGDGIGPEILAEGLRVLDRVSGQGEMSLEIDYDVLHGASWDLHGTFCTDEVLDMARASDAVLVGAVGGPDWDDIRVPGGAECQDGLMHLRYHLQTYLGLRPARCWPKLRHRSSIRPSILGNADVLILREMCGGAMFATERGIEIDKGRRRGYDMTAYDEVEITRFARGGFEMARRRNGHLVSCDKSNVMESYKLWRTVVSEIAKEYPDVTFENMFADNCAYQMMMRPQDFDVVLCCNQLGDILSDLAGVYAGSLGMLPSACLAASPTSGPVFGIYESTSGSAPDIAGKGIANPIGLMLSISMMLDHSLGRPDLAAKVDAAVTTALDDGFATPDIGGLHGSQAFTDAVLERLNS